MKINLANGTFFIHKIDFDQQCHIISQLDIDGIELTFRYLEDIDSCLKENEFLKFLSRFDSNTIHSPFGKSLDIKIYKKETVDEILKKLKKIAGKINAKNIVFHPFNFEAIPLMDRINDRLFTIENTVAENIDYLQLKDFFSRYPKLGFTLDTSHATYIGVNEFDNLFDNLKSNIKTVHLSNAWNEKQHKQFLNNLEDNKSIERFSKIKSLNNDVILTIEENFDDNLPNNINKEISFIRKWIKD